MKNKTSICILLLFIGFSLLLESCGKASLLDPQFKAKYVQTMKSGLNVLPWPKQMEALFGNGDHFIEGYGSDSGKEDWQTEIFFYGRYDLTMKVNVAVDYKNLEIKSLSTKPMFKLLEVKSITYVDGMPREASFDHQWMLDLDTWAKLVSANGDWASIGIPVQTNNPVSGFDGYSKLVRSHRIPIPH